MALSRLKVTPRAVKAIAGVVALSVAGSVALFPGQAPVHDDVALAIKMLVVPWEGTALRAYLDTVAKPHVWTICAGDTNNVKPGMVETQAGCDRRLGIKLERDYRSHLVKCMPGFAAMPIAVRAMFDSLSWNIGWGGVCGSTAAKRAIAGDYAGACEAATAFNRAGGQVVIGLKYRREMGDATRIGEGELCRSGL